VNVCVSALAAALCAGVSWYLVLTVVEPDHLAEREQVGVANDLAVVGAACPVLLPVVPELVGTALRAVYEVAISCAISRKTLVMSPRASSP